MRHPTTSEINDARAYLERRLEACDIASHDCESIFSEAAKRIASIIVKYRLDGKKIRAIGNSRCAREIQDVIGWLISEVDSITHSLAMPEETEEDESLVPIIISATFDKKDHGATYNERIDADRTMLLMALNHTDFGDIDDDYDSILPAVSDAMSKPDHRLLLLALGSIGLSYATAAFEMARRNGKSGFWVINGSSPCRYCASMEGPHQMDEPTPPYHPHCVCLCVYI